MKNVLLMIGGAWHPFQACGSLLSEYLQKTAGYKVTMTQDRASFARLTGYDAVILYTQGGELTPEQEKGLLGFVRGGGGLVGIHCANDSFTKNAGYMEMLGTQFTGHGHGTFNVEHSDDWEQIAPRVAKTFEVLDEFYLFDTRTEAPLRAFQYGWWQGAKKLMGYVRDYGQGRVLYTGLGHDEHTFGHPEFLDLIHKAVRYVTRTQEKTFRWGIVGYGPYFGMGDHHMDNMKRTAGFQVTAVCDREPARIAAAREKHKDSVQYFTDTRELIAAKCCDGVTVIVPHNVHAATTAPLLEAGLHAISEKPFAITPAECDQMIAAAKAGGAVLSVYHSRHWDRDIVAIRQVVEAGTIGDVFAIEHNMCGYGRPGQWWRASKEVSGGLMYDMGAHGFEKAFQLVPMWKRVCTGPDQFRDEPCNRKARLTGHFVKRLWWDTTNEDYARAQVILDSGLEITLTQSSIMTAGKPCWIVSGTQGSIVLKDYCGPDMEVKRVVAGQVRTATVPTADKGTDWQLFYRNYMEHLQSGVPLVITPGLAKAAIQCIHGCEQASREGRVVEVTFDF